MVFRVTTGEKKNQQEGCVTEIPITDTDHPAQRRPIALAKDPRENKDYMWFSNKAGHSVCRIDVEKLNERLKPTSDEPPENSPLTCQCSQGCKK